MPRTGPLGTRRRKQHPTPWAVGPVTVRAAAVRALAVAALSPAG